jgi:transcription initiation factor TFIIF subunit beta
MDVADDDKKPFEVDGADEDTQPDPDEQLMLDQGHGKVWLVKVLAAAAVLFTRH